MRTELVNPLQRYILNEFGIKDIVPKELKFDWDYLWLDVYFEDWCFIHQFKKRENVENFIYDRFTGIVFINLDSGSHSRWMGLLEMLHQYMILGKTKTKFDNFLENNRGFYMSSLYEQIYKASTFKLNAQERMAFRAYTAKDIL